MQNLSRKSFNYSLFFSLVALNLIPAITETIVVRLLNVNAVSMNVMGQIEWFQTLNEPLIAGLTIPMYALLNRYIKEKELFSYKVFKYGVITIVLYTTVMIAIYACVDNMVNAMVSESMQEMQMTKQYLKLETIGYITGILLVYTNIVLVVLGRYKYITMIMVIKTIALVISNAILIPKNGSLGVAYSKIFVDGVLGLFSIGMLSKSGYISCTLKNWNKADEKKIVESKNEWFKIGIYQWLSVLIANAVYNFIIIKMINDVNGLGNYWVASDFIWGWLLLPSYALSEVVKSECKDGYLELNKKAHYKIIAITLGIWMVTMPFWNVFFKYGMKVQDTSAVFNIVIKLVPFYIFYLASSYIQSIFQGLGKTKYCFISSFGVNCIYYMIFVNLIKNGVIEPSLDWAIIMFGFGMVISLVIELILIKTRLDKKEKQVVEN